MNRINKMTITRKFITQDEMQFNISFSPPCMTNEDVKMMNKMQNAAVRFMTTHNIDKMELINNPLDRT